MSTTKKEADWRRTVGTVHRCSQCHTKMNTLEWIVLGEVCGKCCRKNHRAVAGGR